jgi:hypothetical protein
MASEVYMAYYPGGFNSIFRQTEQNKPQHLTLCGCANLLDYVFQCFT